MTTRWRPPTTAWPGAAHLATLAAGFALIVLVNRHGWFRGDEWDFVLHYDLVHRPLDVFIPHNEHLSVLPVLVYKALLALFSLKHYEPFVLALAGVHVLTGNLLWRLARRAEANPWIATGLVAIFLAVGAGFDNATSPFQMSFIGSTAFGLAALLAVDTPPPLRSRTVVAAWVLCLGSMFCSGLGVTFTVIVGMFALARFGRRRALIVVSSPLAFYLLWFLIVGRRHVATLGIVGKTAYLQVPDFVWRGLTAAAEGVTGMVGAGAVLVLALGAALLYLRPWARRTGESPTALALGAVVFFALIAPGRLVFGPEYASQSRYVYEASCLLLVPVAVVLSAVVRQRITTVVVVGVLLTIAARDGYALKVQAAAVAEVLATEKARILAAGRLLSGGAPVLAADEAFVQPEVLTVAGTRRLVAAGAMPLEEAPAIDSSATLDARLQLEVTVKSGVESTLQRATAVRAVGLSAHPAAGECQTVESVGAGSRAWFPPAGPMTFTIDSQDGGKTLISLVSAADPTVRSRVAEFPVSPGHKLTVSIDAPGTAAELSLPAGTSTVCGITIPR